MVRFLLALTLLISGCASVPRYSDDPQNCNPETWGEEYNHDLWNYAKAAGRTFERAMPYICKDEAEVVKLPSYIELLKPRLSATVIFSSLAGYLLATSHLDYNILRLHLLYHYL